MKMERWKNGRMKASREHIVSRTLMTGITVSGCLLIVGFVLYAAQPLWHGADIPIADFAWLHQLTNASPGEVLLNPFIFLYAGIFTLMITPILRLLITGWTFFLERDWHYVSITLIVLVVISISIAFSLSH